jgi:hypothetical protein
VSRLKGKPYSLKYQEDEIKGYCEEQGLHLIHIFRGIIENNFGGSHEWWNIYPAKYPNKHQARIHGKRLRR